MNINIRKSTAEDWETIQRLNNEVFLSDAQNDKDLNLDWPFSDEGNDYYKNVAVGKSGHCLIAEQDDVSVGYIIVVNKDIDYRKGSYMEIDNMGVSPEYQSQGIGEKLIESATDLAKSKGADKVLLSAYVKNNRAISFYKNLGFKEISLELEKEL